MKERYKTVYRQAEAEIVEKKSRFIATAAPVQTEEEALLFIGAMKKKHWNATHNVFAYTVGLTGGAQRASDDGEPGGTAGRPALEVLQALDLRNTAVNITRHFGGTLLGAGGLVRAYSHAAKEGVLAAGVIEKILFAALNVTVPYHFAGKIQHAVSLNNHTVRHAHYTDVARFSLLVDAGLAEDFARHIKDITGTAAVVETGAPVYGFLRGGRLITDDNAKDC